MCMQQALFAPVAPAPIAPALPAPAAPSWCRPGITGKFIAALSSPRLNHVPFCTSEVNHISFCTSEATVMSANSPVVSTIETCRSLMIVHLFTSSHCGSSHYVSDTECALCTFFLFSLVLQEWLCTFKGSFTITMSDKYNTVAAFNECYNCVLSFPFRLTLEACLLMNIERPWPNIVVGQKALVFLLASF